MTKQLEKKIDDLVESFDEKVRIKDYVPGLAGTAIEAIDGPVFKVAIKFGVGKLSEDAQSGVEAIITAILAKDYELLRENSVDNIVDMLKTPLGDAREAIILHGFSKIFLDLVKYEIQQRGLADTTPPIGGGGGTPVGGGNG